MLCSETKREAPRTKARKNLSMFVSNGCAIVVRPLLICHGKDLLRSDFHKRFMVCVTQHGNPFIRVIFTEHSPEQVCPLSLVCLSWPIPAGPSLRLEIQWRGQMCVRRGRWSRLPSSRPGLSCSLRDYGQIHVLGTRRTAINLQQKPN